MKENLGKMTKVVLHIGYHKSASTFLQKAFETWPVNYVPFVGPDRQMLNMVQGLGVFDVAGFNAWLKLNHPGSSNRVTVLSHEELSGHPHGYASVRASEVATNLKELFPKAKILIVVRNQLDYVRSLYTFRVAIKGSEFRSFRRFIKEEVDRGLLEHLQYSKLVERYQQLFGKDNVVVLPMEWLRSAPDDFFRPIYKLLELEEAPQVSRETVNESIRSRTLLTLLRSFNWVFCFFLKMLRKIFKNSRIPDKFRFSYYSIRSQVARWLNRKFASAAKLDWPTLDEFESFKEVWAASNALLEQQTQLDLGHLKYLLPKEYK